LNGEIAGTGAIFADFIGIASSIWSLCYGWLMQDAPFNLFEPIQRSSCVVFAAPHSGRHYAPEFLAQSVLDSHEIRASEDAFVDQLFAPAIEFGAPLLVANAPRAYVDLNRACDELDPAVIEGSQKPWRECTDRLWSWGCAAGRGNWHSDLSREDQPCGGARAY
jgi:hypothetical protein